MRTHARLRAAIAAATAAALAGGAAAQPVDGPARAPGVAPGTAGGGAAFGMGAPLTEEEREVLRDVEAEWQRYVDAANRHHARIRKMLLGELDRRVAEMEKRYADRLAKAGADKAKWRADTKALLLRFIADPPSQEQFTPDARFRLAQILLDEAEEAVDLVDDPTAGVLADYDPAIEQWEIILADFPGYRQVPSVLYLLGHYLKSTEERRSLLLYLSLVCANRYKWTDPPPPLPTREEALSRIEVKRYVDPYADCQPFPNADVELVRHAWVRGIADYHFNVPGELDGAISGYLQVADRAKDSALYPEALYKLAWSYYKRDLLLESIKRFDDSVVLYDATIAAGQQPRLELRDESLQYIAVAFTDPWEGERDTDPVKAFDRAREFYKGREAEPHVRDVWVAMGNAFLELQAYDQAVDSFRIAIGPPWELDPNNPVVHQQIVDAYELQGDKFAADAAAAELATRYAEGTPWYVANEKNREAMENQRRIAERALYASALNTHRAATQLRKEWEAGGKKDGALRQEYLALYESAVSLYETFIRQYPESDYVYLFTFMLGEALFFSERYLEAVEHYKWVRDHRNISEAHFEEAAANVLFAYEAEIAREVAAGRLQPLKAYSAADLRALPQPLVAQPIPQLYEQLREEYDAYQMIVNDPRSAPEQGIRAARVSVAYLHLDDAIARFEKVMERFCGTEAAKQAKDGIVGIHDARGDLEKFQEVNQRFIDKKCGDETALRLAQSQNRSIDFRKADELMKAKRYLEAAEAFYRYYKTAPADDADLPVALYNTAVAYKLGDRPKTAVALFREFTERKDKLFRESPFYLEAMRLTAVSQQSQFDYKGAIASYLSLYEVAKTAKKLGIKPPEPIPGEPARTLEQISLDALFNAAVMAELDRDFAQAIKLYERYDNEEPDRRNSDRAQWAITRIHSQGGDPAKMIKAYDAWRKTYGNDAVNADDVVFSYYDIAKAYQRKGKSADADKYGQLAITAWEKAGAKQGGRGAKLAGEYALQFAERHFTTKFEPYKITKQAKNLDEAKKLKKGLLDATVETQKRYSALERFGVLELTMASKVRYGETLAMYAEKLVAMPYPKDLENLNNRNPDAGVIIAYEDALRRVLEPYLAEARKQWIEVIDIAKKAGISNRWNQLALENLNREYPDEFPVLHQELFEGTDKP